MLMTRRSLGRALRGLEKDLESRKRKIDEELQAVRVVIRINEERDDDSKAASSFASEIGDAIYFVLKDESPLHRNDILKRVKDRGIHVGGANPANNLGTYLSRDDRFKNAGKGKWTLTEDSADNSLRMNGHEQVSRIALRSPSEASRK